MENQSLGSDNNKKNYQIGIYITKTAIVPGILSLPTKVWKRVVKKLLKINMHLMSQFLSKDGGLGNGNNVEF
jgi:hypothetical protein